MITLTIFTILLLVGFCFQLNGFLRGIWKYYIDAALFIVMLILVLLTFFVSGWVAGIASLILPFISGAIFRGLAAMLASKLLSGRSTNYVGLPSHQLEKISRKLGMEIEPEQFIDAVLDGNNPEEKYIEELVCYCESLASIKSILVKYNISHSEFRELYITLLRMGTGQWRCGHWVAASALAYAEPLEYVLSKRESDLRESGLKLCLYFEEGIVLITPSNEAKVNTWTK